MSHRYTFCGLAALALINKVDVIDLPNLLVNFTVADMIA
jgi:prenyltransferase beta subunit